MRPEFYHEEARLVEHFNQAHPVGTEVRFWPGRREGDGQLTKTRSEARLLGGHTAVVWVEDRPDCIALTHVEVQ